MKNITVSEDALASPAFVELCRRLGFEPVDGPVKEAGPEKTKGVMTWFICVGFFQGGDFAEKRRTLRAARDAHSRHCRYFRIRKANKDEAPAKYVAIEEWPSIDEVRKDRLPDEPLGPADREWLAGDAEE